MFALEDRDLDAAHWKNPALESVSPNVCDCAVPIRAERLALQK
jgi:hypothetical protein